MSAAPYLWLGGRRRAAGGVIPTNIVLWLQSDLGLSGADGSNVTNWPDQSVNGYNALNTGSVVGPTLQKTTGVQTPNGKQTVLFWGGDNPNQSILGNTIPNPYPSIAAGWTFYFGYYMLPALSSSGLQMLWDENSGGLMRYVPEDSGTFYGYRTSAEVISTTASTFNAWQSNRWVFSPGGAVDIYVNGVSVSWPGAHTWTLTPGGMAGYTLGNLLANEVTGFRGYLAWLLWYGVQHSAADQKQVDNALRGHFGMSLI